MLTIMQTMRGLNPQEIRKIDGPLRMPLVMLEWT
jgi:hypothetical protein|eukprot:COSAG01_NODE_9675_length_2372_cov_1.571491_1_plen_34_part_00